MAKSHREPVMKILNSPADERLRSLLRATRPSPALLPRFEENVWRRIEADEKRQAVNESGWLGLLAGWCLRPKFALALMAVVAVAGLGLGWIHAEQQARFAAQARYVAAVAPNSLR